MIIYAISFKITGGSTEGNNIGIYVVPGGHESGSHIGLRSEVVFYTLYYTKEFNYQKKKYIIIIRNVNDSSQSYRE